ncbi:hypothetical protein GWK47_024954 [Chionoecetes opilio]|uniref:Uncharacterized protein n=1 Tax=Chionoecetes opilio TaxID=41210 RepID=A0A8J5CC70_CHIOP|nr:hypothetical protein GWK47_024954 [Chionoecetes opilio]
MRVSVRASLVSTRKHSGPIVVPWGTPQCRCWSEETALIAYSLLAPVCLCVVPVPCSCVLCLCLVTHLAKTVPEPYTVLTQRRGGRDMMRCRAPPSFLLWEILYRGNSPTVAEVKMELFRSHCYSIYCNSLWSRYKVATLNRLKVCHNDILKRLLGLPRWCSSSLAFARNGVNNLDVIRRHSVFSLRSRVELSTNSIITSVRQSSAYVCGPIQQRWLGLLFVQNVG